MEFNAVYHQASDNYCYPLNEDELIINASFDSFKIIISGFENNPI